MRIAIIGTGYVGLVSGACFSEFGTGVVCVDKDAGKVDRLLDGVMPIYEPGLDALVEKMWLPGMGLPAKSGKGAKAVTIAVSANEERRENPPFCREDCYRWERWLSINRAGRHRTRVHKIIGGVCSADEFDIASNPEFLREGSAIRISCSRIVS